MDTVVDAAASPSTPAAPAPGAAAEPASGGSSMGSSMSLAMPGIPEHSSSPPDTADLDGRTLPDFTFAAAKAQSSAADQASTEAAVVAEWPMPAQTSMQSRGAAQPGSKAAGAGKQALGELDMPRSPLVRTPLLQKAGAKSVQQQGSLFEMSPMVPSKGSPGSCSNHGKENALRSREGVSCYSCTCTGFVVVLRGPSTQILVWHALPVLSEGIQAAVYGLSSLGCLPTPDCCSQELLCLCPMASKL